jgi:hypothetical protein
LIVATTLSVDASTTDTVFDNPLAVYTRVPSCVIATPLVDAGAPKREAQ